MTAAPAPKPRPPQRSVIMLPINSVHPSRSNIRRDLGDLAELTASIKAVGMLQPLLVQRAPNGKITIVDGHRRYAAALGADRDLVPCIPAGPVDAATQVRAASAGQPRPDAGGLVPRARRQSWFVEGHPLARKVKAACTHGAERVMVGGIGCGQCWQDAITTAALQEAAA